MSYRERAGQPLDVPAAHAKVQPESQVPLRTFNETMAPKDPADFLGTWLAAFAVNFVLPIPEHALQYAGNLRDAIYEETFRRLSSGEIGRVDHEVVDYSDSKVPAEPARRYIRVRLRTPRDNQVTTLFRCFVSGVNLYVAIDSYRLGRVSVTAVAWRACVSFAAFIFAAVNTNRLSAVVLWPLFGALIWWFWGDVLRAARHGGLSEGLRSKYPKSFVRSSFDLDDSYMFLKAELPLIMQVLREVGPRYGLDLTTWEETIAESVKRITSQTVVNNVANYGQMSGVNIGGSGNTAASN